MTISTRIQLRDPRLLDAISYAHLASNRVVQTIAYIHHIASLCDDEAQAVLNDLTDELYEINVLISASSQCIKTTF